MFAKPGVRYLLWLPVLGFAGVYLYARAKQQRLYQILQQRQQQLIAQYAMSFTLPSSRHQPTPGFTKHLAVIPDFLPPALFERLRVEAVQHLATERSYFPLHKQGGTVAYETLHTSAPPIVAFYQTQTLRNFIGEIVGEPVQPTPLNDQNACSLLFYTQPGDHINWHYDYNFYDGRHFTVLLPLVNQRNQDPTQPSAAQLMVKQNDSELAITNAPNTLIIFEGAKVLHKVTRLQPDETRVMLSMTFTTTPQASLLRAIARRFKDVAFFGPRALWT